MIQLESSNLTPLKYALESSDIKKPKEPIINYSRITGQENITSDSEKYIKILELSQDIQRILDWMEDYSTMILIVLFIYGVIMIGMYFVFAGRSSNEKVQYHPPVQIIHHETPQSEADEGNESESVPFPVIKENPQSSRIGPIKKLDNCIIPGFELQKSRNSIENIEEFRKISDVSVFSHNHKTESLEVQTENINMKMSPNIEHSTKFKFSK